jgi:type VI protein secretion system component Hcp
MNYVHLKQVTLASAIAVACTLPIAEDAWAPVFAKYDGVDGESADHKHEGWIDVLSWSWGMSSDESGKSKLPCVEDLRLTKYLDSATPVWIAAAHSGETSSAIISVEEIGQPILTLEVADIKVKELKHTQRTSSESRPVEEVAFSFSEVLGTYQRLPAPDGSVARSQSFVVIPGKCKPKNDKG